MSLRRSPGPTMVVALCGALALGALAAWALVWPAPADARARKVARDYFFDGFRIGDSYARKVMGRVPYQDPCDNDPIDKRARRFMVYGALPCRDRTFPQQTTVMFYLKFSQENRYDQPIEAFAFLHGSYFTKKTTFPLKPGDPLAKAKKRLGKVEATFDIARKRLSLTVHRFVGDIYVLSAGPRIVGFVIGTMPQDPASEQWRGLMQMYQRYTPKAGAKE